MKNLTDGAATAQAETEVPSTAKRRRFTSQYKLAILKEADRSARTGAIGELLRREGLYSAMLSQWRQQRDQGMLTNLSARQRGRKPRKDERDTLIQTLERENRKLKKDLIQAQALIDFATLIWPLSLT